MASKKNASLFARMTGSAVSLLQAAGVISKPAPKQRKPRAKKEVVVVTKTTQDETYKALQAKIDELSAKIEAGEVAETSTERRRHYRSFLPEERYTWLREHNSWDHCQTVVKNVPDDVMAVAEARKDAQLGWVEDEARKEALNHDDWDKAEKVAYVEKQLERAAASDNWAVVDGIVWRVNTIHGTAAMFNAQVIDSLEDVKNVMPKAIEHVRDGIELPYAWQTLTGKNPDGSVTLQWLILPNGGIDHGRAQLWTDGRRWSLQVINAQGDKKHLGMYNDKGEFLREVKPVMQDRKPSCLDF